MLVMQVYLRNAYQTLFSDSTVFILPLIQEIYIECLPLADVVLGSIWDIALMICWESFTYDT